MALHALEDLDDALEATRNFLTPVDRTRWLKLALIIVFVGVGAANPSSFSFGGGDGGAGMPGQPGGIDVGPEVVVIILAVVAVALLLGLVVGLIGSIMEFVLIESLRNEAVTIREYWSRRWKQGLRLFGFRIVIGLFFLAGLAVLLAPIVLPLIGVAPVGGLSIGLFLLLLPLFLVLALVFGIVGGFTTVFVVPIMIQNDVGVLAGWRRLWPTITAHWTQYLAYAVANFFLGMVGGVLVGITTALGALVLLLPFGVLFAVGIGLLILFPPVGIGVLVIVGILYVLSIISVAALIQVPVTTYLRYYALLVLGDVEPEFDLIPDQRAAVRSEPETGGGPESEDVV